MSKTLNGTTRDVPHPRTTDSKEEKNPRIGPDSSIQKQRLLRRISNGYGSGTTFRLQEYRRNLSLLEGKAEDGRGDGVEEKGRIKMKSWKAIKDIFIGGINYEKEDYR